MNRKGIKRIGLMSLLVLSLLIFAPAGRAQAAGTGTVRNRVVNVRSNATTASSIVAKLTQGTSVSITSETTGSDGRKWYNVSFKYNGSNKTGCIRADLLNATGTNTGTSAANTSTASVSGFGDDSILAIRVNSARVRKQASTSAAMVTTLNKDDQVKQKTAVTGSDGKTWIRVSFTKGGQKTYGYIRSDLLTLVKMDRKSTELNVASTDINDFIEQILKRLRPIAEKANIELVFESNRSVTAEIDATKLSLAFSNLVENAIKYNRENGWVRVSLDADHKFFYVKVSDSGIGIPQESIDYIFERFYRVDKSHSREIGGTGLGLAIAKEIVELHDGQIMAKSDDLHTQFIVTLPSENELEENEEGSKNEIHTHRRHTFGGRSVHWKLPKGKAGKGDMDQS